MNKKQETILNTRSTLYALRSTNVGFTLVEMMVAIGIFLLITAGAVFSFSKFQSNFLLTNLAYDIALSIRQAQSYGVSARESATRDSFSSGYGIRFASDDKYGFALFYDNPESCNNGVSNYYDRKCGTGTTLSSCKVSSEYIKYYNIGNGNYISKICAIRSSSNSEECNINYLDITFKRPNPEPFIWIDPSGPSLISNCERQPMFKSAYIKISTATGDKVKTININSTGQVIVSNN